MKVRVRVPATTSNLGPGFDVLGMALSLYNEVVVEAAPGRGLEVDIAGEGAQTLPRGRSNMLVRAALSAWPQGPESFLLKFRLVNRIPLARGLGSSAAARLGGLLAAHFLAGTGASRDSMALRAARLEGHPDNALPAYYGGVCLSIKDGKGFRAHHLRGPEDLAAVVCVPDFELSTKRARAVLPAKVSREDAVRTASRVAWLVAAFEERRYELLGEAMRDILHQPYRKRLVPGMDRVIAAAREAGAWGAALSGAGPSILALSEPGPRAEEVGKAMEQAFERSKVASRSLTLAVDRGGAVVERVV